MNDEFESECNEILGGDTCRDENKQDDKEGKEETREEIMPLSSAVQVDSGGKIGSKKAIRTSHNYEKKDGGINNDNDGMSVKITIPQQQQQQRWQQQERDEEEQEQSDQETSIAALLSVPLEYIFRQRQVPVGTSDQSSKPPPLKKQKQNPSSHQKQPFLLSKTEAMTIIQVSNLAHELDCLVQMATNALYKAHLTRQLSIDLSSSNLHRHNNYLRPIHVLLKIHGDEIPNQILHHVQSNMDRILFIEFPSLCQVLNQCSEQNWSVSSALQTSISFENNVSELGKEKGIVAEIEEELCKRMNGLIEMSMNGTSVNSNDSDEGGQDIFDRLNIKKIKSNYGNNHGGDTDNEGFLTMAKLCHKLFHDDQEKETGVTEQDDNNDEVEMESKQHDMDDITQSQRVAASALGMLSSWGGDDVL